MGLQTQSTTRWMGWFVREVAGLKRKAFACDPRGRGGASEIDSFVRQVREGASRKNRYG